MNHFSTRVMRFQCRIHDKGLRLKMEAIESTVLSNKGKEYLFLITSISMAQMRLTESNTSSAIIGPGSAYSSEQP